MSKEPGPYEEEFRVETVVSVVTRQELDRFRFEWKYHHPLQEEQLNYAGMSAVVKEVFFYHGGDVLYVLREVPGVWHGCCLKAEVSVP